MNGGAYDRRPAFIAGPLQSVRLPGNAMAAGAEKIDATVSAVRKLAEHPGAGIYSKGFPHFLSKSQLQGP